jgi:hypothetical protein
MRAFAALFSIQIMSGGHPIVHRTPGMIRAGGMLHSQG